MKMKSPIRLQPLGLRSVPPTEEMLRAAGAVTARWNEKIPCNRVRVMTVDRLVAIRLALQTFSVERIIQAIDYYGRQSWQRKKNAWKKFDAFMEIPALTRWIEEAMEAQEKAAEKKPPRDPRVARLARQIVHRQADMNRWDDLRRQFKALPPERQQALLRQAAAELRKVLGPGRISEPGLAKQALVILARSDGKDDAE